MTCQIADKKEENKHTVIKVKPGHQYGHLAEFGFEGEW